MSERRQKVEDAMENASAIREAIENVAAVKEEMPVAIYWSL